MSSESRTSLKDWSNEWAFVIVGYAVLAVSAAVRLAVIISESIRLQNRSSSRAHAPSTLLVSLDADAMDAVGTPQPPLPRIR